MNKKIIISLTSFVISAILIFVFIVSFWSSIKVLRIEITQNQLELSKTEELLLKTQQLEKEYQEVEQEVEKILLALPKQKDISFLLVQFETLAVSNGLLLESIKLGQVTESIKKSSSQESVHGPSLLRNSSANIVVIGSYSAFKKYLSDLESGIRSMDIQSIDFSSEEEGEEAVILTPSDIFEFDLEAKVYYGI